MARWVDRKLMKLCNWARGSAGESEGEWERERVREKQRERERERESESGREREREREGESGRDREWWRREGREWEHEIDIESEVSEHEWWRRARERRAWECRARESERGRERGGTEREGMSVWVMKREGEKWEMERAGERERKRESERDRIYVGPGNGLFSRLWGQRPAGRSPGKVSDHAVMDISILEHHKLISVCTLVLGFEAIHERDVAIRSQWHRRTNWLLRVID
jgi:hypothetical protein